MLEMIDDPGILQAYNEDALGIKGRFEGLFRPETENEVMEIVRDCASKKMPLTCQGLRSCLTGAAMCETGAALSLERMNRLIDIDAKRKTAVIEPGMVLSDFQKAVQDAGLMYAPDPTSAGECTIGGNVATNASGSRSLKYGATIDWVRGLRVVDGAGRVVSVKNASTEKMCAGYGSFYRPAQLFVGSEGTLGVVTRIEVSLTELPANIFLGIVFFPNLNSAVDFTIEAHYDPSFRAASMEFLDRMCLDIIRPQAKGITIPSSARAMIYFEQEYGEESERDHLLNLWFPLIEKHTPYSDDTQIAASPKEKKYLYELRHHIPSKTNEESIKAVKTGGCKISTDWAVPHNRLHRLFEYFEEIRGHLGDMMVVRYGHLGSGHPHFNFIARNREETIMAQKIDDLMAEKAVALGGCVSAEHGIGKMKRRQLALQYPAPIIRAMKAIKNELDPAGIMAPGNLFELK
ncbi:MAG: FAD-binding oxidoreductase [Deltaproteobacteria bacterium]|nr:FAD-binding oxidoreductase [Deltaproteobacteria bacterium]